MHHLDPRDPEARSKPGISALKEHAVQLARQDTTEKVEALSCTGDEAGEADRTHPKSNLLAKLKRLQPGGSNVLGAVQKSGGSVTNGACEMTAALRAHWEKVVRWLDTLRPDAPSSNINDDDIGTHSGFSSNVVRQWKVRRRDVLKALKCAGSSTPGPGGVPFGAWRALKELGVSILLDVAGAMEEDDATAKMLAAFSDEQKVGGHSYNLSSLVCLPKSPTGGDPDLGFYFKAADTRPLSIAKCDNRLVASAMRWRWEENLAHKVKERQHGFLRGRSIFKNLIGIENEMLLKAVEGGESAAVFLDFSAAVPSISQTFVRESLARAGVPSRMINAFNCLYGNCQCKIAMKGSSYPGFQMEAGVRQGCPPPPPLLYAVTAENILEKLEREVGGILVKAYTDDTALVISNFWDAAPTVANMVNEFEAISGLRLNHSKSIAIPLGASNLEAFASRKLEVVPERGGVPANTLAI